MIHDKGTDGSHLVTTSAFSGSCGASRGSCLAVTPLDGLATLLRKLSIQLCDLFRARYAFFYDEIDHLKKTLCDVRCIVQLYFAGMDGVIADDSAVVKGFLRHSG